MQHNLSERKPEWNTRTMVTMALLMALVFVGSAIRITMPVAIAGTTSFHLGNIMCALSGILLGPVGGGLSAGIGSMLYDFTNPLYISESWITLLTKGAYGVAVGLVAWSGGRRGQHFRCNVMATVTGALVYAALYLFKTFVYGGLLLGGLTVKAAALNVLAKLPATTFNAVVAVICAPLLARAVEQALKKARQLA